MKLIILIGNNKRREALLEYKIWGEFCPTGKISKISSYYLPRG